MIFATSDYADSYRTIGPTSFTLAVQAGGNRDGNLQLCHEVKKQNVGLVNKKPRQPRQHVLHIPSSHMYFNRPVIAFQRYNVLHI